MTGFLGEPGSAGASRSGSRGDLAGLTHGEADEGAGAGSAAPADAGRARSAAGGDETVNLVRAEVLARSPASVAWALPHTQAHAAPEHARVSRNSTFWGTLRTCPSHLL